MALFKVPVRNTGKAQDNKIAKKANAATRVATATVKGSGGIIGRISSITAMVDKYLSKYKEESIVIDTEEVLHEYISACIENNVISIDTETTGLDPMLDEIAGICIYTPGQKTAYIPVNHISYITFLKVPEQIPLDIIRQEFQRIADNKTQIIMFNGPFDVRFMEHQVGVRLHCYWDCMPASKLLNENELAGEGGLKALHKKYCLNGKGDAFKFDDLFKGIPFTQIPIRVGYLYAAHDAKITYELYQFQKPYLIADDPVCIEKGLQDVAWVFHNIEMPMVDVVIDMEDRGIAFDLDYNTSLSKKYNILMDERKQHFYELCDMYRDKIEAYENTVVESKLDNPINIASPAQIAILLYDILKIEPPDKRNPRATGVEALSKMDNPIAKAVLEYREMAKLITTYIDKMPDCVNPNDGRVHCKFHQYGAATGRMSCISEGTKISSPGGDKNIEDMKPGDWVYCYDDHNRLTLSRVKNSWFTGVRNCVELSWKSKYNPSLTGTLICTPDHFIRTDKGWVMAKDLTPQYSILYVHRRPGNDCMGIDAWRGQGEEEEHIWIKKNYYKVQDTSLHIHHLDYNRMNNSPDNLVVTTGKAHMNIHRADPDAHFFGAMNYSHQQLVDMAEEVNWELSKINHDYNTIIGWLKAYRINYILKYTESYSKRDYIVRPNKKAYKSRHLPLSKTNILYSLELSDGDIVLAAGYFGVSTEEFEDACEKYEILSNHSITGIKYLPGSYNVYDLEVEGFHNFIANELCVHNSSDPNLQNIPSHNKDIRQSFVAQEGYVLLSSDFSQQEPKCLAALCRKSGDDQMYNTFMQGKDLYSEIASKAFNVPYEECREFRPDGTTNKAGKERRTQAKSVLLGVLYGRGEASIGEQLHVSTQKAKDIKESVFKGFPAIKKFEQDSLKMAHDIGFVTTVCGRKRRLPDLQLDEFEFTWKAGCAPQDDLLDFDDTEDVDVEVPYDRQRYYRQKLKACRFWEKHKWIEKAAEEGIHIVDNGAKIADATRQCVNSRIQGSAADLTKIAMVALNNDERLKELGFRLLVPVHDEVIAECPEENVKECSERLADIMCSAAEKVLDMPISCDVEISRAWYGPSLFITEDGKLEERS